MPFRKTNILRSLVVIIAGAMMLWCASGLVAGQINGSYETTVKGDVTGKGVIAVGAKSVTIVLHVEDENGKSGKLMASNLMLVDGRFTGQGTVMGETMTISGRIEPPDSEGPIKAATIQATFMSDSGKSGRLVGYRRGNP